MTNSSRLPAALRASAVSRWSHRDAVEGGNPFPTRDRRHEPWDTATRRAKEALLGFDAELAAHAKITSDPDVYRVQLLGLAEGRFDVWARRGLSVVWSDGALRDYEQWLVDYTGNWLQYVRETCPGIDVDADLRARLGDRAEYWVREAREMLARQATEHEGRAVVRDASRGDG